MPTYLKSINKAEGQKGRLLRGIGVPPIFHAKSFDNFQHKQTLTDSIKKSIIAGDNLYIHGTYGLGKTHLLASVASYIYDKIGVIHPGLAFFSNIPNLLIKIKSTYSKDSEETEEELVGKLSTIQYFFLDDLGSENPTEWASTIIFTILENRFNNHPDGMRTYITSNYSPGDLYAREAANYKRLASRTIEHCQRIEISDYMVDDEKIDDYRKIASKKSEDEKK